MLNQVNSTMTDVDSDDVFEVTDKNYQRIAKNLENSGYTEGITDGRDSIFQGSFDKGYEDGFRIGFLLGKAEKPKSSRGNCAICLNPALMKKPEEEAREAHQKNFEEETSTS